MELAKYQDDFSLYLMNNKLEKYSDNQRYLEAYDNQGDRFFYSQLGAPFMNKRRVSLIERGKAFNKDKDVIKVFTSTP